jgi:DNA repair exonuclease SbcCD ATPase subunit
MDLSLKERRTLCRYKLSEVKSSLKKAEMELKELQEDTKINKQLNELLSNYISYTVQSKTDFIKQITNKAINYVIPESNLSFDIESTTKNNNIMFKSVIYVNGVAGDINTYGGGVIAMVSFMLRVSFIIMSGRPKYLFLDESLNHLSKQYQDKMSQLIKYICDEYGFTILLVTHQEAFSLAADKNINLNKVGNYISYEDKN